MTRIVLAGLGNVGRSLLGILRTEKALLLERHGLSVTLVGAVDSTGAALDPQGLDLDLILAAKTAGQGIGTLPGAGRPGMTGRDLLGRVETDALLEATPINLEHGGPGLDHVRAALGRGIDCVLANKGPLALRYQELAAASDLGGAGRPALRFSACVGGALPTIDLGVRDLAGARILAVEAVLNGTCQGILRAMESGQDFLAALAEMQRRGVAETDPDLDIDGWDQAVKLVIVANAVLHRPTVLRDVAVTGIRGVTRDDLDRARARGERLVLLGRADRTGPGGDWRLTVGPVSLPMEHRLARMGADEMGIVYHTDISGILHATSEEADAIPTAAAMLRDLIAISRPRPR